MKLALAFSALILAQFAAAQAPPPAAPPPPDPSMQFVDQVMRTATAVHALIRGMNLENTFGPQNAYPPGDPRALQRTAEFMGMGAGVGMALGEMGHSQKGMAIGAAVGTAGGLIVDQILRHQALKAAEPDAIPPDPPSRGFRERKQ